MRHTHEFSPPLDHSDNSPLDQGRYVGVTVGSVGELDFSQAARYINPEAIQPSFETLADEKHTQELHDLIRAHGMAIEKGNIRSYPNEKDFRDTFSLSNDAMDAIGWYMGAGARIVNDHLRHGKLIYDPSVRKKIETLLGLFGGSGTLPATKGGEVVYRGMPTPTEMVDDGFMSTTIDYRMGLGFADSAKKRDGAGYLAKMALPAGVHFLPIGGAEGEVILQPGLTIDPIITHPPGSKTYEGFHAPAGYYTRQPNIDGIIDVKIQL